MSLVAKIKKEQQDKLRAAEAKRNQMVVEAIMARNGQQVETKPVTKPAKRDFRQTGKQDFHIKGLNIYARSYNEAAEIAAELLTGCRDAKELNEICSRAVSNY